METVDNQNKKTQNNKVAKSLMHVGSSLRGTMTYWTKCHSKLMDMITNLACPSLFFKLCVADTKWPYLKSFAFKHIFLSRKWSCEKDSKFNSIPRYNYYVHAQKIQYLSWHSLAEISWCYRLLV